MPGELLTRFGGTIFALFVLQVALLALMMAVGAGLAIVLFPEALARYPLLGILGGTVWGALAGIGVYRWLPGLRRPERAAGAGAQDREEFTRSLSLIVDLEDLLENQIQRLQSLTGARRVAVLVSTASGEPFRVRASRGYEAVSLGDVVFAGHAGLAKWLFINETHLAPGENVSVVGSLPEGERGLLRRMDVAGVFPLVALNRLVGMVFLSGAGSAASLKAVPWMVPQMALALANAMLYEQQRIRIQRLSRAERLATTGQLAAGAAHEIRNPLTSIRSTIQYLKRRLRAEDELAEMVGDLIEETDRINAIVEGMLSLASPGEPARVSLDLGEVVAQTVRLVAPMAKKQGVVFDTVLPEGQADYRGDAGQLRQVFLNVLMNAVQAMPRGAPYGWC